MRTGEDLRITQMGQSVMGVVLEGNPQRPEPIHFRVVIPGGDVDIVRTSDDDYWVHVRVNHPGHGSFCRGEDVPGKILDARLDLTSKHTVDVNVGDFNSPDLYHLAVRVTTKEVHHADEMVSEVQGAEGTGK